MRMPCKGNGLPCGDIATAAGARDLAEEGVRGASASTAAVSSPSNGARGGRSASWSAC